MTADDAHVTLGEDADANLAEVVGGEVAAASHVHVRTCVSPVRWALAGLMDGRVGYLAGQLRPSTGSNSLSPSFSPVVAAPTLPLAYLPLARRLSAPAVPPVEQLM